MNDTVIVALISLAGTLLGSLGGIVASGKLTNYRIAQLEKRVGEFGALIEKTNILEQKELLTAERLKALERRIGSIEKNKSNYAVN